jgi:hypothetical protein
MESRGTKAANPFSGRAAAGVLVGGARRRTGPDALRSETCGLNVKSADERQAATTLPGMEGWANGHPMLEISSERLLYLANVHPLPGRSRTMPFAKQVPVRRREQETPDEFEAVPAAGGGEDLIEDIDELLDEIDSILEEQAVLTNYRQRSGQ